MNPTDARHTIDSIVDCIDSYMEVADNAQKQLLLEAIVDALSEQTQLTSDTEIVISPITGYKWHEHLGVHDGGAQPQRDSIPWDSTLGTGER